MAIIYDAARSGTTAGAELICVEGQEICDGTVAMHLKSLVVQDKTGIRHFL